MATEAAPAPSDHPAPSEEVERKPRSEAKDMEAEAVESVKHDQDSACPAESQPEVEPIKRLEDDIRPTAEAPLDVETIEKKTEDIIDNKSPELPSAEEESKTQVAEHKPLDQLPTRTDEDKPRTEKADSKPESERGEGKIQKHVLEEEAVETTEAKDVAEDEFKAEEVISPATPIVEEKPPEKVESELVEKLETAVEEKIEKQVPAEAVKTIGAKDLTEFECRAEQVSPMASILGEKPSEKSERQLEEKLEMRVEQKLGKEVPADAVKTIEAKDVMEDECRAQEVSPGVPIVEEKSRVTGAEPLGKVEVKIQTLPKDEESGATENPTLRVEEKGVECYSTEEVKEKTGEEKEPPAKEISEVKEKVSDPGKIEATSDEKSGATQDFVQFDDANVAEDEVTDRDIMLITDNAKIEAHNKEANAEMEKSVAEENTKEAVQATEEKIEETAGAIITELKGEKKADEPVNDATSSDPLPELIVENVEIEADTKEASEETDRAAEKLKEPVQASEEKLEETVEAIKAELEVENQVNKPVNDAKSSDPLPQVTDENAKAEADDNEPSDELQKNVAAESIKENVQATEVEVEEIAGAAKGELEGEKQAHVNDAKNSGPLLEVIAENVKTEADNKEASEEMNKNVTAEKIIEPVQATEDTIEETVRAIKPELEGEKHVDEAVNDAISSEPLPEITAENTKTKADNKVSSDELEKDVVVAESTKETVQATEVNLEETIGATITADLEGEKQVDEPVNDAKCSDPLPELITENVKTEADTKEAGEGKDKNVTEPVEATEEKIEEIVEAIKDDLEGEKLEPVNDVKESNPLPELVPENAKTEADDKKTSEETNKNVAAAKIIDPVQATEEKIEETVGAMKAELEGEKQVDEPVQDARSSYPLPELIAENAKTKADNNESSDEQEKNVAAESIKETAQATEVKIEENVATKGKLEGEKQASVNDAKNSDPLPELIAEDTKTEDDNKEASEEANKNVAAEKIIEPIQATGDKIEETFGAIKAKLEGEKQVDEPVNDTRSSDPLPEPIAENASSDEPQRNVVAESIKETVQGIEVKIEETVGAIKDELEGEKQVDEPVNDAKCSVPLPELDAKNAKAESDNKEASKGTDINVAVEKIKENVQATEMKIEENVGAIKGELEGDKQVYEPVDGARSSDPLPELNAENVKTEADTKEASEETDKHVAAEKIQEPVQATEEKIEETDGPIKAELEGGKQVDDPTNDERSSDPLPELLAENAKTNAVNKESSDEPDKNVVAESIKETVQATEVKIEETVEGEKQVDEPVNDAKSSVPLPELDAENAKTEVDSNEASKGTDKNVAVEKIKENVQATELKIDENVGALKGEVEGEKQVYEPVNDARSLDPLPELNAENVKTEAGTKEASEETDKNVAAEKIQEPVQATEENIGETDRAIKAELEGGKKVDDPINDARSSDPLPELKVDNKESSDEPDKNVAAESIKETVQPAELNIEETVGAIKTESEGEKQVEEPVKNPECSKEIDDSKKPQDVPVKTHKQSIVKMVKQSLVKAKKAITGKSQNSKTPASEPKAEGN